MKKINIKFHKKGYAKILSLMEKYRDLEFDLNQLFEKKIIDRHQYIYLVDLNIFLLRYLNDIKKGL